LTSARASATPGVLLVVERHPRTPDALHAVDAASGDRRWRVTPPDGADAFSDVTLVDGDA